MQNNEHSTIEELLGVYVLDAVDDIERTLVEQHLAECESCRVEVDSHREVAAILTADFEPAPERVWARIANLLDEQTPPASLAAVIPLDRERHTAGSRALNWMAGIAAAVAVVLGAAVFSQSSQISDLNAQLATQEQEIATLALAMERDPLEQAVTVALDDPAARVATLTAEGNSGAMLIVVQPDGTGYVYESTLEQLSDELTYQLWAVVDDKVISAGVLGNRPDIIPFHIDPEGLQGLVITREVTGGVPQSEGSAVVSWFGA